MLGDVACELGHTNLLRQVPLEGGKQNLTLRGLESVHDRRNRPLQIVVAEVNQVLVNKVRIRNSIARRDECSVVVALEPLLAVVCTLLVEGQINRRICSRVILKLHCIHLGKVLLGLISRRCAQSLVVLDLPRSGFALALPPLLVLILRVEHLYLRALHSLDNRSCHVRQKPRNRNQLVPQLVEQIDQQPANVATVQILVRHNHDGPIPQVSDGRILLTRRQPDNLLQLGNLLCLLNLGVRRILHVQHLALERIDTERLSLLLAQSTQSHRLG